MKFSPLAVRRPHLVFRAALAALLVTAAGAPSALAAEVPEAPSFALGQVANLAEDEDGRLLGLGGTWEARFDGKGALFLPLPGRVPSRPLELHLGAVRAERGGATLELHAATPEVRGDTAVYTRAPGVEERFEATLAGLFHSLWFERPLGSQGDLVVTVALGGSLRLEGTRESNGTHRFGGDDGGVHYGELIGIDAAGRTTPGEVRLVPGGLQLVLPAAFVDTATWPLVLDPLIGTSFALTQPSPYSPGVGDYESDGQPDIAYDVSTNTYLLVWQRRYLNTAIGSPSTTWTRALRFNAQGQPLGTIIPLSVLNSSRSPRVVNINGSNRFAVVWIQDLFGETQVRFRAIDAATGSMSNNLYLVGLPEGQITNAALTGEWSTSPSDPRQAWVFWDSPTAIRGARVLVPSSPNQPSVAATFTVQGGTGLSNPAASRTVSQDGRIGLVWTRTIDFNSTKQIWGNVLNRSGTPLHPSQWISAGQTDARFASIEGGGTGPTHFLVTWNEVTEECQGGLFPTCTDYYRLYRATLRSGQQMDVGPPVALTAPNAFYGIQVGMGWRNQRTLLAYSDGPNLRFLGLDTPSGAILEGPQVVSSGGGFLHGSPAIAMQASGGAFDSTTGLLAYTHVPPSLFTPSTSVVRGRWLEAFPSSATAQNLGGGCGMPGSSYVVSGAPALGNGTFQARLLFPGAGTNLAIFNVAPPSPGYPWFPCGTCQWVPFFSTIPRPGNSQLITVDLPIPGNPALAGIAVDTQWTTVKLGAEPCALAPGLAASNIQRLTLQ